MCRQALRTAQLCGKVGFFSRRCSRGRSTHPYTTPNDANRERSPTKRLFLFPCNYGGSVSIRWRAITTRGCRVQLIALLTVRLSEGGSAALHCALHTAQGGSARPASSTTGVPHQVVSSALVESHETERYDTQEQNLNPQADHQPPQALSALTPTPVTRAAHRPQHAPPTG